MKVTALLALVASLAGCAAAPVVHARNPAASVAAVPAPSADAPDPLTTDPDKYSLVLENDRVRVLRYHDRPGAKTKPHHHRQFLLVVLAPFRRRLSFPDGTVREREFRAGEVLWMPDQTHTGENTGTLETSVLLIEVK